MNLEGAVASDERDFERGQQIGVALGVQTQRSAAEEIARRVQFLCAYVRAVPGARGFVLGISGGQDSSLAGRLCQLAVETLRSEGVAAEFWAVRLPHGTQHDEADAQLALEFIRADHEITVDIAAGVSALTDEVSGAIGAQMRDFHRGNVKARMRMVAQFAVAAELGLLVVGTDHAAEAVTGFFTKFGDGAADIMPLSGLLKRQGAAMLRELGAPDRLWVKEPTADLLDGAPGQSDAANLGVEYTDIDAFLSGEAVAPEAAQIILRKYLASEHKRRMPVTCDDDWWKGTAQ